VDKILGRLCNRIYQYTSPPRVIIKVNNNRKMVMKPSAKSLCALRFDFHEISYREGFN
jgi:hypothetical protein